MRTLALLALASSCTYAYSTTSERAAPRSILATRRTNSLAADVAVRHRREPLSWKDISVVLGGPAIGTSTTPPSAQLVPSEEPRETDKLVIEAWIDLQSDDVTKTVLALRARVASDGGRVISETIEGAEHTAASAAMEIRVPPGKAAAFTGWVSGLGIVESSRTLASDVGKTLVDQELELANLRITMQRLQALAERDVPMQALLDLEKEMTRVRGELERIEGERRFLLDRVEFATVTINVKREGEPVELGTTETHLHPGPHVAMLALLDPGMRARTQLGGGMTFHVSRALTFDFDVYPRRDNDTRTVTSTVGTALYAGLLGGGRRTFLNPYLGARAGYGYLSGHSALVVAGELGLELYKQRYILVEASARATGFIAGNHGDAALITLLGLEVPF